MISKRILTGAALAVTVLGLTIPRIPIHADPAAAGSGKTRVQVEFEWVRDQSPPSKTLTLSTTTDTTGTVALEPSTPGGERASATIQPHLNADNTITVRFSVDRTQGRTRNALASQRTLKPGERVYVGGLVRMAQTSVGSETHTDSVFMTATVAPADDGTLTGMTGFGRGGFLSQR